MNNNIFPFEENWNEKINKNPPIPQSIVNVPSLNELFNRDEQVVFRTTTPGSTVSDIFTLPGKIRKAESMYSRTPKKPLKTNTKIAGTFNVICSDGKFNLYHNSKRLQIGIKEKI